MRTAIVYHSSHHGCTKKLLDAIARDREVDLIDASSPAPAGLEGYELIGFASGIYYGKFHQSVLDFARERLPRGKRVFFLCTYGGKADTRAIASSVREREAVVLGEFGCKGFDTFGPFRLVGGINKGRPNGADLEDARRFFARMCEEAG